MWMWRLPVISIHVSLNWRGSLWHVTGFGGLPEESGGSQSLSEPDVWSNGSSSALQAETSCGQRWWNRFGQEPWIDYRTWILDTYATCPAGYFLRMQFMDPGQERCFPSYLRNSHVGMHKPITRSRDDTRNCYVDFLSCRTFWSKVHVPHIQ